MISAVLERSQKRISELESKIRGMNGGIYQLKLERAKQQRQSVQRGHDRDALVAALEKLSGSMSLFTEVSRTPNLETLNIWRAGIAAALENVGGLAAERARGELVDPCPGCTPGRTCSGDRCGRRLAAAKRAENNGN